MASQVQKFVLKPHETRVVYPLDTYAPGTYLFAVTAEAVGLLSSLYAKTVPVGATVQLKHFYYVTGHGSDPGHRVDRQATTVITDATAPTTASAVVTQFHHTIQVELIVTGSPVECAVMVTPGAFSAGTGQDVNVTNDPLDVNLVNQPISVVVGELTTPTIANVTISLANTEQSHTLPASSRQFVIKPRGPGRIQLAYVMGQSGTSYLTISPGSSYQSPIFSASGKTLYFQSPTAGLQVEIESWV